MKEYIVAVNNSEYRVTVENSQDNIDYNRDDGAMLLDVAKSEYEHCIKRSEKLDNKIYILLTVCAFLFVLLVDIIKSVKSIEKPTSLESMMLFIIFILILSLCILLFATVLIMLARLLRPILLGRIKSEDIIKSDLIGKPSVVIYRTVAIMYEQCKCRNNNILEERYRIFGLCINLVIGVIILLILLDIISLFL